MIVLAGYKVMVDQLRWLFERFGTAVGRPTERLCEFSIRNHLYQVSYNGRARPSEVRRPSGA